MLTGLNFDSINSSPWFLDIDTGGHILGSKVVNHSNSEPKDFASFGGLTILGTTYWPLTDSDFCSPGLGGADFALNAIDSNYLNLWCKTIGGSDNDRVYFISSINDSLIAICGNSASTDGARVGCGSFGHSVDHAWLGLINLRTREVIWQTTFCSSVDVIPLGLSYDYEGQYLYLLLNGGVDGNFASVAITGTNYNSYLVKYAITITGIKEETKLNPALSLYPNPTQDELILKIQGPSQMNNCEIYDDIGRPVMVLFKNQRISSYNFNCGNLSSGFYFLRVTDTDGKDGVIKFIRE